MRWRLVTIVASVALSAGVRAQSVSPGHTLGCDLCHDGHIPTISNAGQLVMATRTNASGPPVTTPSGFTAIAKSCLRCHYSTTVRTTEMTPAQLAATGGANAGRYVGATLLTSHRMGGSSYPLCRSCHLVHVPGQLLPVGIQIRALCTGCHQHADKVNHPDQSHLTTGCPTCHRIHTSNFGAAMPVARAITPRPPVTMAPLASIEGSLPLKGERSPGPTPTYARRAMDGECMACHALNARAGPTEQTPAVQVDIFHIQRGGCVECHQLGGRK